MTNNDIRASVGSRAADVKLYPEMFLWTEVHVIAAKKAIDEQNFCFAQKVLESIAAGIEWGIDSPQYAESLEK